MFSILAAGDVVCNGCALCRFFEVAGNNFRSHADSWKLLRMYISGFRSNNRPERFPVQNGRRVLARRKGGTSGMFRPDSAGIRPEQESCTGFRHPKNRNESRNVQPRTPPQPPTKENSDRRYLNHSMARCEKNRTQNQKSHRRLNPPVNQRRVREER